MELLEIMRTRRSIRSYKDERVSDEAITKILQAALLAESGRAIRPWEFIVVRNKETLKKMADCRMVQVKMLLTCDAAIVVLADGDAQDVWVEDASIAMAHMHLMAHDLGLGSCWVQGRLRTAMDGRSTEEFVRDILGYPENMKLLSILTIGVPDEEKEGYDLAGLLTAKIHDEKY